MWHFTLKPNYFPARDITKILSVWWSCCMLPQIQAWATKQVCFRVLKEMIRCCYVKIFTLVSAPSHVSCLLKYQQWSCDGNCSNIPAHGPQTLFKLENIKLPVWPCSLMDVEDKHLFLVLFMRPIQQHEQFNEPVFESNQGEWRDWLCLEYGES